MLRPGRPFWYKCVESTTVSRPFYQSGDREKARGKLYAWMQQRYTQMFWLASKTFLLCLWLLISRPQRILKVSFPFKNMNSETYQLSLLRPSNDICWFWSAIDPMARHDTVHGYLLCRFFQITWAMPMSHTYRTNFELQIFVYRPQIGYFSLISFISLIRLWMVVDC